MQAPGAGTVLELRRGGLAIAGEMPLAMGQHVAIGTARGTVLELRDETVVLALYIPGAQVGQAVAPADPPGLPVGATWLGRVWTESSEGPRALAAPPPAIVRASSAETWLPTGFRALDQLAPVTDRTALLLVGQNVNSALAAIAAHPRDASQILVLPAAAQREVDRAIRRLGAAAERTAVLTTPAEAPELAHLRLLQAASTLAHSLADRPVLVLLPDLHRIAVAARTLDRGLGRARDRLGWSLRTGQQIAQVTDRCGGSGEPVAVVATASLAEPGLDDHLVPWFDRTHTLVPATRPGMLPALDPARLSPARNFLLPAERGRQADLVRAELVHLARQQDLATITRDPELLEAQERRIELLRALEQPAML